ncbi:hypothetical protein GGI07_001819 [Coemansia sp. Benny D115]|nr:hypothetical protein GGI07_001819 [Coemansia sp. Benny D115]
MAFAAGAAVTIPTITALGALAYYAKHPRSAGDGDGAVKERRGSLDDSRREFFLDDDPSEFSTFSSGPSAKSARRRSMSQQSSDTSPSFSETTKPDHSLLEEPHLQVWRDRYKWGRNYGVNYAHNDR